MTAGFLVMLGELVFGGMLGFSNAGFTTSLASLIGALLGLVAGVAVSLYRHKPSQGEDSYYEEMRDPERRGHLRSGAGAHGGASRCSSFGGGRSRAEPLRVIEREHDERPASTPERSASRSIPRSSPTAPDGSRSRTCTSSTSRNAATPPASRPCSCMAAPAAASIPPMRRYHDPRAYRIVLFDQRGCGRSHAACLARGQHHLASGRRHRAAARASRHRALAGVRRLVGLDAGARLRRDASRARHRAGAARHLHAAARRSSTGSTRTAAAGSSPTRSRTIYA